MLFHAYKWPAEDLNDPLYQKELTAARWEKDKTTPANSLAISMDR